MLQFAFATVNFINQFAGNESYNLIKNAKREQTEHDLLIAFQRFFHTVNTIKLWQIDIFLN